MISAGLAQFIINFMKYLICALALVAAFDFEETYDLGFDFAEVGQTETEEEEKGGFPWLIVILLLLAAGGGAAYYYTMM